ncbi:MAG TPA: histidine kinase [Mycobacteriales bacterium]|nr:histidine kinase [Mycobacteriales bacterium]
MSATEPPVRSSIRAVWLVGLVYVVAAATHPGGSGRHLAASVLTATTALGWAAWLVGRHLKNLRLSLVAVAVVAASGGVIVVLHPIGVAVVGIAGLCAGSLLEILPAAALTAPGVVSATIAYVVAGNNAGIIANAASGAVAGLIIGMSRRQGQVRAEQEAALTVAQQRAEVSRERAEVLAQRNHIAREVHDVLAHTLSALSVQMNALSSLIDDDVDRGELREAADKSRRLVAEGLQETRRAVRVLRDEPVEVAEQIGNLAEQDNVTVHVSGRVVPLPPAAGLALVRVAQEAVTNARKHAADAAIDVTLTFADALVTIEVTNATSHASALADTGAGYGLQGMRERVELVGGTLIAGPNVDGWRVRAEVPA